jgi:hypothetical protein
VGSTRPAVVFAAHYDCAPGSKGANDNGAAVFMLLQAAFQLHNLYSRPQLEKHGSACLFILTDKEELKTGDGAKDQGAYKLAKTLKETGMSGSSFFIFDACGIGDTLIISSTIDNLLKINGDDGSRAQKKLRSLRSAAMNAAEKALNGQYLLMPTPFSDDMGFLRAGLVAQTLTVLPKKEAMDFSGQVRANPLYKSALISSEQKEKQAKLVLPKTWQYLNSPQDTAEKLTGKFFPSIVKFILALCAC